MIRSIRLRIVAHPARGERARLRPRLLDRCTIGEPSHHSQIVIVARPHAVGIEAPGRVDARRRIRKGEPGRYDADNSEWRLVDSHRPADDGWIGRKFLNPDPMPEND